jgi:hypothetical protein
VLQICCGAGGAAEFVITPFDAHGNAGASGGRFAAELLQEAPSGSCGAQPASPRALECTVTESATGSWLSAPLLMLYKHYCRHCIWLVL